MSGAIVAPPNAIAAATSAHAALSASAGHVPIVSSGERDVSALPARSIRRAAPYSASPSGRLMNRNTPSQPVAWICQGRAPAVTLPGKVKNEARVSQPTTRYVTPIAANAIEPSRRDSARNRCAVSKSAIAVRIATAGK